MQGFLEFTNFYRWFIKTFSQLVWPLTQLIKKNTAFNWSSECKAVFQMLKKVFTEASILQHFDWEREFTVETDAFNRVTADVLMQKNNKDQLHPVVYFFSKMFSAETNYNIYNKEPWVAKIQLLMFFDLIRTRFCQDLQESFFPSLERSPDQCVSTSALMLKQSGQ